MNTSDQELNNAIEDLLPPMGIRNDRDMLNYLMAAFDNEMWNCPCCGHAEDTKTMDSASLLRDYLATVTVPACETQK